MNIFNGRGSAGPNPGSIVRAVNLNATSKRFRLFTALFVCVGMALNVAVPVNADPSPFGDLSCSCHQPVPGQHHGDAQQIIEGIKQGLADPPQPPISN